MCFTSNNEYLRRGHITVVITVVIVLTTPYKYSISFIISFFQAHQIYVLYVATSFVKKNAILGMTALLINVVDASTAQYSLTQC